MERTPASSSSSTRLKPWRAHLVDLGAQPGRVGDRARRPFLERRARQIVVQPGRRPIGQQHPAERCAIGRQARADVEIDRHDPCARDAGEIDDLVAVHRGGGAAFLHRAGDLFHEGLGDMPPAHRRQIGVAEAQDVGREREMLAVGGDEAEIFQGQQETPRGGPCHARRGGDLGQRHRRPFGPEGLDHRQPARQRADTLPFLMVGLAGSGSGAAFPGSGPADARGAISGRFMPRSPFAPASLASLGSPPGPPARARRSRWRRRAPQPARR